MHRLPDVTADWLLCDLMALQARIVVAEIVGQGGDAETGARGGDLGFEIVGAQHVIVGRDADFAQAIGDLTGKRGVDVAHDGVGGTTLAKTFNCVRPFGVVASIGQAAGPIPPVDVSDLGPRRSISLARPSVMAYMNETEAYRSAAAAALNGIQNGILSVSGRSYPLSEAARAHADLEAGRTSGALYLTP